MARPTKQGIDYFPLDCIFDDKTEMYLIETGATGLAILVSLWQMIYSNHGYYITDDGDLHLLIKRRINVDINDITACINTCLRRNLFHSGLYEKHHILTSKAIQKRFFDAAKRKMGVNVCRDYLLFDVNSYNNLVNVDINEVNSGGNATNVKGKVKVNVKVYKSGAAKRIFEHWKETLKHPRSRLDDKRTKLINTRLKNGYSEEDLCLAITGCSLTPHNIGENDRHERYDSIELILRNNGQIDRFMNNANNPPPGGMSYGTSRRTSADIFEQGTADAYAGENEEKAIE